MDEVPFNLPTLSRDVFVAFSKYPNGTTGFPHCYIFKVLPDTPQVSLRAGSVTSLTLGSRTVTPSTNIVGTPGEGDIPAGALSYNIVKNGETSKLYMWCDLDTSGGIYWWLVMVGPGNSGGAAKEVLFSTKVTFSVTTSDVLNENDEVILRGGEFSFPVQVAIVEKDLPFTVGPGGCFREFFVGESVEWRLSMYYVNCNVHEPVGDGYGCGFPGANIGGKIISPNGDDSGLRADTYEVTADGETYTAGVRIHGTAMRPGLYLAHIWSQSNAIGAPGSGGGGTHSSEFPSGENSELIIISIRERGQLPGDPMLLVPHDVRTVPDTRFSVTHSEINNVNDFQTYITSKEPADVWEYHDGVWDEPEVWTQTPEELGGEFLEWLLSQLNGDEGNDHSGQQEETPSAGEGEPGPYTGHVHLAGYWTRSHSIPVTAMGAAIGALRWWYVICHDNDGYWRLYCALDTNVTYSWFEMARTPELGLDGETPPKYWPSVKLCAKGSERHVVADQGVFAHAGYLDVELPLPDDAGGNAEPETVTVEVFQQQPLHTTQHAGWRDLTFYPPEYQFTAGKLLYSHPEHGWVCIPSLDTEITAENVGEYRVSPVPVTHIGVPFAPVAPPMVVGNNAEAIRRDPALSDGTRGISVGNIDGVGPWNSDKLVLMGDMAAAGFFDGGVIWPHYPLQRMVNFERLRLTINATVKVNLLGMDVGTGVTNANEFSFESRAYGSTHPPEQGDRYDFGKEYLGHGHSSEASGKCMAELSLTDVPCWYNGYLLFAEIRGVEASMGQDGDYDNSIEFVSGDRWDDRGESESFWIGDGEWTRTSGFKRNIVSMGDAKSGTLTAGRCRCGVWLRGVVGAGREVNLCPPKMTGSDRPSRQIVFAGEMGVTAEWHFAGACEYQHNKYIHYNYERWVYEDIGKGHWEKIPQPADDEKTSSTVELTHSASRSWATGLQVWHLGGANRLHGQYAGVHRSYSQLGQFYAYCEDLYDRSGYSSGSCEFEAGSGSASGRTSYEDITPNERTLHPILYYTGNASCHVTTTIDGTSHTREYHYPDDTTGTPTAADAQKAYGRYLELVQNCDEETPAVANYRSDGRSSEAQFAGTRSSSHREEDIELTIEIREG